MDHVSPMTGDITTDLAVVGGGYTGLSTALHAAERDIDCHVLEAMNIGCGGSGRNAGPVNADRVVLGTNVYSDDLWLGLRQTFTTIHYFLLATPPWVSA